MTAVPRVCGPSFAALLFAFTSAAAAQDRYTVTVDPSHPARIEANLRLPVASNHPLTLIVRGSAWGLDASVRHPRCGSTKLAPAGRQAWTLPAGCTNIDWEIEPRWVGEGGTSVADQASLYLRVPHLWLISEPTSLLRIKGNDEASSLALRSRKATLASLGATPLGDGTWRVPSANHAPEYYVIGNIDVTTRTEGAFEVRYVGDDPARVERFGLVNAHERALRYLSSVLPPSSALDARERELMVIWIGTYRSNGRSGGSAGSRSFVANYIVDGKTGQLVYHARTLMAIAHEQFHQLADLARGPRDALPVWFNESIASYYGLKALALALDNDDARKLRAHFIDPQRPVTAGLMEWQRRQAAHDPAAYPSFYAQGATFWNALDDALHRSSSDVHSLDALVPELIQADFGADGALPAAFVAKLHRLLGTTAGTLLNHYVGK